MARIATIPFIKGLKLGVIESGDYFVLRRSVL